MIFESKLINIFKCIGSIYNKQSYLTKNSTHSHKLTPLHPNNCAQNAHKHKCIAFDVRETILQSIGIKYHEQQKRQQKNRQSAQTQSRVTTTTIERKKSRN